MHTRGPLGARVRQIMIVAAIWLLVTACASRPVPENASAISLAGVDAYEAQMMFDPPVPVYTPELPAASLACAQSLHAPAQGMGSWAALEPALRRSRDYLATRPSGDIAIAHGDITLLWSDVAHTVNLLLELLPRLDAEPGLLAQHFEWLRLTQGADFSGYSEAVIKASKTRSGAFVHPLYRKPPDLHTLELGAFAPSYIGQRVQYRLKDGRAVPYYTRHDIDAKGVLRGRGLEMAYVADPLDAYFLQVQGSGRLEYQDGEQQPILYAATNGRPYVGLGRVLRDRGLLGEAVSTGALRRWLEAHPEQQRQTMDLNPRYVFFRFADEGPIGGMGSLLTPWVSLAVDRHLLPLGAPVAYALRAPFADGSVREVRGLGLAQDTGSALKGRRIDIFCGRGEQAAYTAGHLDTQGTAWLLVAKPGV